MDSRSTITYFRTLAFLAIFLLWGISLLNGTVKALILAVWKRQLGHAGAPLKTDYTGFPLLDYPIALLVTFFFYGTNGHDEGYQLFLLDAYSTLQSAYVWVYVETLRPGTPSKWISRPIIFGLLWQCFGAAISLPLYYALHTAWVGQGKIARAADLEKARALPLSFALGAVLPAVVGMAPTWFGPEVRSAETHQIILAAWQPDPIWVSLILTWTAHAGLWICGRSAGTTASDRHKAHWWVCASYILAASSSAAGHLYVMGRIIRSRNNGPVNFARMYMPLSPITGHVGAGTNNTNDILIRGPWLFLQYDLIIISLSSLSWAFVLLLKLLPEQTPPVPVSVPPACIRGSQQQQQQQQRRRGSVLSRSVILALILLAGSLTIGPGATVSLALFVRERRLPEFYDKASESGEEKVGKREGGK